jgi:hypothetical protein
MQTQNDMQAHGIDYGNGLTNIDKSTGIRFGVINANELAYWYDESEADYGEPSCPECGNEVKTAKGKYRKYRHAKYECGDYVCHACKYVFGSESAFSDSPIAYMYDKDGYLAKQSGDDCDIFVIKSPYYTRAKFCSPCAPGACYLMDACGNGAKCYCFGHDCFENGVAPYPVYSVETNELIAPID